MGQTLYIYIYKDHDCIHKIAGIVKNKFKSKEYLEGVAELNYKGVDDFSENVPLGLHVIHMVLLYDCVLPHHLHRIYPITISFFFTLTIRSTRSRFRSLPHHLEHFTKRPLPHNSQNLEIPRPKLPHFLARIGITRSISSFGVGLGLGFGFGCVDGEGAGEGEAGGGAHEGVGPVVDDGWVPWGEGGG